MWALQRFDFLADSDSDDHGDGKGENLKMGADYDFEYDHFEVISLESVVPAVDDLLDLPPLPQQLQRHQARLVVPVLIVIEIRIMLIMFIDFDVAYKKRKNNSNNNNNNNSMCNVSRLVLFSNLRKNITMSF